MQIESDYDKEVYNGDIGYIVDVDPDAGELAATFDGRSVTYGFGELDTLVPAYPVTIHKSQGSEYPAVVIPVLTQHYAMLQRNLLYTGITRGKRLVVLVGQKKAIAIAVRNVSGRRRWWKLDEWLRLGALSRSSNSSKADRSAVRTNLLQQRKFVARLALRRLCPRRAGALHGSEIQVEQGLLFVALVFVLLAQAQDFPEDFHIEALSLGLCEDFLLASFSTLISSSMRSTRSTKAQMRSPGIPAGFVMPAPSF
jgi:hypothetical protein